MSRASIPGSISSGGWQQQCSSGAAALAGLPLHCCQTRMPTSCQQFFDARNLFKQDIAHDESSVGVQHQLRQQLSPVEKAGSEMARLLRLLHMAFASPVGMLHLLRAVGDAQSLDHPSFAWQWSFLGQVMIVDTACVLCHNCWCTAACNICNCCCGDGIE